MTVGELRLLLEKMPSGAEVISVADYRVTSAVLCPGLMDDEPPYVRLGGAQRERDYCACDDDDD